jgi:glycosyltransferase involved in cell wall biosynthesis
LIELSIFVNLLLIADAFPPTQSSAAVHMHDLATELNIQGHQVTVLIPTHGIVESLIIEQKDHYQLIRVKAFNTKGVNHVRRLLAEWINPLWIIYCLGGSNLMLKKIEGIIWYSPSIFFGPLVRYLVGQFKCPTYLVLRDLFPRWALDLGILKEGLFYRFLQWRELSQYQVADTIGIQAPGNAEFFKEFPQSIQTKLDLLWSWTPTVVHQRCSIEIATTALSGRKIFLYTGNMGVAQNLQPIIELAGLLQNRLDLGFLMVGRGDQINLLKNRVAKLQLNNIIFRDEISAAEIPALCSQCFAGIVSLDVQHQTHNIPGKFLTYMSAGLPVLAKVNSGNDLIDLISQHSVGVTVSSEDPHDLMKAVELFPSISLRCQSLAKERFSTANAARQIIARLQLKKM